VELGRARSDVAVDPVSTRSHVRIHGLGTEAQCPPPRAARRSHPPTWTVRAPGRFDDRSRSSWRFKLSCSGSSGLNGGTPMAMRIGIIGAGAIAASSVHAHQRPGNERDAHRPVAGAREKMRKAAFASAGNVRRPRGPGRRSTSSRRRPSQSPRRGLHLVKSVRPGVGDVAGIQYLKKPNGWWSTSRTGSTTSAWRPSPAASERSAV